MSSLTLDLARFDYYLVIDLEATCCDRKTIRGSQMEIIEIGAVLVESTELQTVDEFQTFVRPIRHPRLTPFCTQLTSITQAQVDQASTYPEAIAQLQNWLQPYESVVFGSWGDYDRRQFIQDSKFHRIPYPFSCPHVNLKRRFQDAQNLSQPRGMVDALRLANLPLEGTHHRGIDDARNIAKLLPLILQRAHINPIPVEIHDGYS